MFEKEETLVSIISAINPSVVKVATGLPLLIYGKWTWGHLQMTLKYNIPLFVFKYLNLTLLLHVFHVQIKIKFLSLNKLFLVESVVMIHMIQEQIERFPASIVGYNLRL